MQLIKKFFKKIWQFQFVLGVKEIHLASLSKKESFSKNKLEWNLKKNNDSSGIGGWFYANNHSSGYHGILRQWWDYYGLGSNCLLVSESIETSKSFSRIYSETNFISTDYYLEISDTANKETHYVWNLYKDPPSDLREQEINSILFQATLEHLIDPVAVMKNLTKILAPEGHIYIHTHTPLYPYHACPKDYLRYQADWFIDIGDYLENISLMELVTEDGHIFSCYKKL